MRKALLDPAVRVAVASTTVTNSRFSLPLLKWGQQCMAAVLAALFCIHAFCGTIEAEGLAPMDLGSTDLVREAAILDAVKQGELQAGAQIESFISLGPNGLPLESSRLRAAGEMSKIKVVKEWSDGKMLHVTVRGSSDPCNTGLAGKSRTYKKKVITTRFEIPNVASVSDLPNIWTGLTSDLRYRLEKTGKFVGYTTEHNLYQDQVKTHLASEANRRQIINLANEQESQFVVIGSVLNAGIQKAEWMWQDDTRQFEIEVGVYDGLTGAQVAMHRESRSAKGDVIGSQDKPFGTSAFFATAYGKAISSALDSVSNAIEGDLECLPFTAKIIRIEGKKIFFNAGTTSGVEVSDKLVVYLRDKDFPIQGVSGRKVGGVPENPLAAIQVVQVQPLFSVAELTEESGQVKLREGDLIRFETRR